MEVKVVVSVYEGTDGSKLHAKLWDQLKPTKEEKLPSILFFFLCRENDYKAI
jgi:hypothetical protein